MTDNMTKNTEFAHRIKDMDVLVVGLGKSGRAAVEVLLGLGARLSVQDATPREKADSEYIEALETRGVRCYLGIEPEGSYDFLVLSPGVPTDLGFILRAREGGAHVIGELELAYRLTNAKFIAITGTNGKTTTTTLVGEIFKASGRKTHVVGNIGEPVVTSAVNAKDDEWMITEASSFQLETTKEFKPLISAILNLTPDHLNRHKTMEAYGNAKANIALNQSEDEYLIINYDDEMAYALGNKSKAKKIAFTRRHEPGKDGFPETGAYLDGSAILIKDEIGTVHNICDTSELKIIGNHNVENVLAAAAICYYADIDVKTIANAIKDFGGVEHRIEYSGTVNGVDYYNDSKGTNVDAAIIAIKALEKNIILIAGGDGKSQDFTELSEHLAGKVKTLVLLGRDAPIIEEAARRAGYDSIVNCKDMEDCVNTAARIATEGDKVLLSPACASWDMYECFERRGEHFKKCVKALMED